MDIASRISQTRIAQQRWAAKPLVARLRILQRIGQGTVRCTHDLEVAVERFRPRSPGETLASEILPLAETASWLYRQAPKILAESRRRRGGGPLWFFGSKVLVLREPHGVVLVIGPSNYPVGLAGVQALHALAAGNGVIWKPGTGGTDGALTFQRIAKEAGLPGGVLTVLDESPEAAQSAIAAGVDKVVLTGSAASGAAVLNSLANHLTPATMELSGCDAVFALPGADEGLLVKAVAFGMRFNQGATCIGPHRLFARREMLERLGPMLAAACRAAGPCLVPEPVARRVRALARDAVRCGARLACGNLEDGTPFVPLLLADAAPEMRLLQEDTFAPVLSMVSVGGEEEALSAASICPYALGATVFGPAKAAAAFAKRVPAGFVVVNDMIAPLGDPRAPFGGRGKSGFGTTRGAEGLLDMTRCKTVVATRGRAKPHLEPAGPKTRAMIEAYLWACHGGTWAERLRGCCKALRGAFGTAKGHAGRLG